MSIAPRRRTRPFRPLRAALAAGVFGGLLVPVVAAAPAAAEPLPPPSTCNPAQDEVPEGPANTDPYVVTTGIAGAPTDYEFGFPQAPYTFAPKGYMLVIHGGGWVQHGQGMVAANRFEAAVWRARGWATLNITYHPCAQSIDDVFWYYQHLRSTKGPNAVICATGHSAGGHLAMMIAGIFPDLDCAISQAGPLVLDNLHNEVAANGSAQGADTVSSIATGAFGLPPDLMWSSPHAWVGNIGDTRLLLAIATNDSLIPLNQARAYRSAVLAANPGNYVDLVELPAGNGVLFVHGTIDPATVAPYRAREDALVAPLVGP